MKHWKEFLLASVMIAAACNRNDRQATADSALNHDLSLASQVAPYQPIDSMEAGLAAGAAVRTPATRTPPRTTARRSGSTTRSSGTRTTSSGGSVTTSSGGEVVVQKNTKRDAIIGAAAGAAIGAATSKDRVKGAVVGGVVGGVLGGVIGNNVDVKKTRRP
jgi:hypothetical protein